MQDLMLICTQVWKLYGKSTAALSLPLSPSVSADLKVSLQLGLYWTKAHCISQIRPELVAKKVHIMNGQLTGQSPQATMCSGSTASDWITVATNTQLQTERPKK